MGSSQSRAHDPTMPSVARSSVTLIFRKNDHRVEEARSRKCCDRSDLGSPTGFALLGLTVKPAPLRWMLTLAA